MRLITAFGCCLLLATFVTTSPDVSHLKYSRRPYKKLLVTTTAIPNTKSDALRKESTYAFKPRLLIRKGIRNGKLTTAMLLPTTTPSTPVTETVAAQSPTATSPAPTTTNGPTVRTTENDDILSVIDNSDSIRSDGDGKRNERDGTSLQDAWDIRHNIPGEPGVDYPIYSQAPESKFDCENRHDGYYADTEARCQVFHVCANTALEERGFIFLCPNGTVFSQENFVCDWYTNVNCPESEKYYYKNEELGRFIGSKEEMLREVQKMFDYTLRNLLNTKPGTNDNGGKGSNDNGNDVGSENSIAGDESLDQKFGNFSAIPILNPKMRKTGNTSKGKGKTSKEEVYISNLGELSTDPGADFDINVVKQQAKLKSDAAIKSKVGSFAELWGQDIEQLDAILSQNRLKKSSDGNLFVDVSIPSVTPAASTVTKRDVSHLLTTPEYIPPNRYLPSLRKINLRPPGGYHYEPPVRPLTLTDTETTTKSYVNGSPQRTRPPTTKQMFTRRPLQSETVIVTPVTLPTIPSPPTAPRRPTFKFDATDNDTLLEYRGNFISTDKLRGDQKPDDQTYDDVADFESKKENPSFQTTTNYISNESPLPVGTDGKRKLPKISSTTQNGLGDSNVTNRNVKMMKRPIILLMPPYKINRTMDEKQEIVKVFDNTVKQTKPNVNQKNENVMVVFASGANATEPNAPVVLQQKFNAETFTEPNDSKEGGSLLFLPPFEQSTKGSILTPIPPSDERVFSKPNIKVTTEIIDLEDEELDQILIDPDQLNIGIRTGGMEKIERTTVRIGEETKALDISQIGDVQTNNRDDRLALIQKMIKMLEQKMKLKHGDLPPDDPPSAVTSRFLSSTTTPHPVTQFNLDNIIREMDTTQSKGVGANLIFAMMKILENAQNKTKENARPGDGSLLQPIFSSLSNAQTESPIKLTDEEILNNEDVLSQTINLLQNSDNEELKSILEVNEIEQIRKNGNLVFVQTTPKNYLESQKQVEPIPLMVAMVQQRGEIGQKPQITIKEIFRNGNTNVKSIMAEPDIKSVFDSKSINGLTESSHKQAPPNVIKYSFGTQVNNGAAVETQATREPTTITPSPEIKAVIGAKKYNKLSDPSLSVSKTRIAEVEPTRTSSSIAPNQNINTIFDSQQPARPADQPITILSTRVAEDSPVSRPYMYTTSQVIQMAADSQQFNRQDDELLDISKNRVAAVSPATQPISITNPVVKFSFGTQINEQGEELPVAQINSQMGQILTSEDEKPVSEVIKELFDANFKMTPPFDTDQYNQVGDPSLSIPQNIIAQVDPTRQPSADINEMTPVSNLLQNNRVSSPAAVSVFPQPIASAEFDSDTYNQVDDPSLSISKIRITQDDPTARKPSVTPKSEQTVHEVIGNLFDTNYQITPETDMIFGLRQNVLVPAPTASSGLPQSIKNTIFDSDQYNQVSDPSLSISKTRINQVEPMRQPSAVTPKPVEQMSSVFQQYNQVSDPSVDISKTRLAEMAPSNMPFIITPIAGINTAFVSQQPNLNAQNIPSSQSASLDSQRYEAGSDPTRAGELLTNTPYYDSSAITSGPIEQTFVSQSYGQVNDNTNPIVKSNTIAGPTFESQQHNRGGNLPQPSLGAPTPIINTLLDSQQNNQVGDPSLSISKTRIAQVDPTRQPSTGSSKPIEVTPFVSQTYSQMNDPSFDTFSKTRVGDPTTGISKAGELFTITPSYDSQQYNRVGDPALSISKTRISQVEPTRQPSIGTSTPIEQTSFVSQPYNQVSDPSVDISKTRVAEAALLNIPSSVTPNTNVLTSFGTQQNVLGSGMPARQPSSDVPKPIFSKTRVSDPTSSLITSNMIKPSTFSPQLYNQVGDLTSGISKSGELFTITPSYDSQQYNQVGDPSLSISKTRISQVDPTRQPSIGTSTPVEQTSFVSQPYNQVSDPSVDISKTRVAEAVLLNIPSSVTPNTNVVTSFGTQQNIVGGGPSQGVLSNQNVYIEPARRLSTNTQKPQIITSFDAQQYNRMTEPTPTFSKTQIPEAVPLSEPPNMIISTTFNSQPHTRVNDPSIDISKNRIAHVEPAVSLSTVTPKSEIKTSFTSQQYNPVSDPSLSISKTRIAEVAPAIGPVTMSPKPGGRVAEVASVSGPYPVEKPLIEFTFEEEINNLVNIGGPVQKITPASGTRKASTQAIYTTPLAIVSSADQSVTPKAEKSYNEVIANDGFNIKHKGKSMELNPVTTKSVTRTNGIRTSQLPNVLQNVPETRHNVIKTIERNIPDLADSSVEESDVNVKVEGKFTGFLNNNPNQNNLGVKSKGGYVYENKLSPEVLKIYNINGIGTAATRTTSAPILSAETGGSSTSSAAPTFTSTRIVSTNMPTVTVPRSSTTTPKPIVLSTTTTPKLVTTTIKPILLTRPVPTMTTKTESPLFIRIDNSVKNRPVEDSKTREIFLVSKANPLTVTSSPKTVTSPQIKQQIAVKTPIQPTVSNSQPGPLTYVSNSNPTSVVHRNVLQQLPGIVITPSIGQSLGHVVTQGPSAPQKISLTQSTVNPGLPPLKISTEHSVFQQQNKQRPIVVPDSPLRVVTQQPVQLKNPSQSQQRLQRPIPQHQNFIPSQQEVGGLQSGQARRPIQEQYQYTFPNQQRPQTQQNTNHFIQSPQGLHEFQTGQALHQPYESSFVVDRPAAEPVLSNQFPFGTEQHIGYNNDATGGENVIVNIVPSINWYLNDARDRNSYFAAIQGGLVPSENLQFNQGHLRYGTPLEFQNHNSFGQQYPIGGHRGQSFSRRIDTPSTYVENSNRRIDNANVVLPVDKGMDAVFRGLSSYNAPLGSIGKLPCDSDSVSGHS